MKTPVLRKHEWQFLKEIKTTLAPLAPNVSVPHTLAGPSKRATKENQSLPSLSCFQAQNFSVNPIMMRSHEQTMTIKCLSSLRPSKGGSLVALSHPFVYLCRLASGGNCRCRFSVQIHVSFSLQEFVSDVSLQ